MRRSKEGASTAPSVSVIGLPCTPQDRPDLHVPSVPHQTLCSCFDLHYCEVWSNRLSRPFILNYLHRIIQVVSDMYFGVMAPWIYCVFYL